MAPLSRKRMKDLILYVGISSLFVGIVLAFIISGVDEVRFLKWFAIFFGGAVVFGFWIEQNWDGWKSQRFWYFTIICFAVHLIFWSALLWHVREMNHVGRWLEIAGAGELFTLLVCWNFLKDMTLQKK